MCPKTMGWVENDFSSPTSQEVNDHKLGARNLVGSRHGFGFPPAWWNLRSNRHILCYFMVKVLGRGSSPSRRKMWRVASQLQGGANGSIVGWGVGGKGEIPISELQFGTLFIIVVALGRGVVHSRYIPLQKYV